MAQPARPFTERSTTNDLAPLRRHVALARSLLDELERFLPPSSTIPRLDASLAVGDQLAEELGRMACRLLECAAFLTGDLFPWRAAEDG